MRIRYFINLPKTNFYDSLKLIKSQARTCSFFIKLRVIKIKLIYDCRMWHNYNYIIFMHIIILVNFSQHINSLIRIDNAEIYQII